MNEVLEKKITILPSMADYDGKLGYYNAFGLFMDIAAEHADMLNIGMNELKKRDMFWLTAKTKVIFNRRPRLGDEVIIRTWPDKPEKVRANRSYSISDREGVMVVGKTEWAIINFTTKTLVGIEDIYPEGLKYDMETAIDEPFARIGTSGFENAKKSEHIIRLTDVDLGGHMNNTAYVRALLDCFSSAELKKERIDKIDVIYRAQCYEGDTLVFSRRDDGLLTDIKVAKDNAAVLLARIERSNKS